MKYDSLINDLEKISHQIDFLEKISDSTILITGATGLVGSIIVHTFLYLNDTRNANIKIIAQVRTKEKVKMVFGDLLSENKITIIYQDASEDYVIEDKVDYIIHTASPTASEYFVTHPVETIYTAFMGTKQILELAKCKKSKGIVYLSSMEVYGVTNSELEEVTENDLGYIDITKVRSSYSEGKRICELLCVSYAEEYNIPVRIARLAQTFGAGVNINENRVFAQFAKSVINGTDIVLHTDGTSEGNYCYTTDAVMAILILLTKGVDGEAYTICNEKTNITIADMAQMVAKKFGNGQVKVIFDIPKNDKVFGYAPTVKMKLSSKKIRELGWKATINLEEMYERLICSFLEQMEG